MMLRAILLAAAGATALWAGAARAQTPLPTGFAGIDVGTAWSQVEAQFEVQNLASLGSPWGRYAAECGYRAGLIETDSGQLLLTANEFVVTDVSYTTPIQPGADLLAVADLVMQTYGQPDSASMRSLLGEVTIDKEQVNFITLHYDRGAGVTFTVSGRDLWQYQISVRLERYRWHENQTLRCAREREESARQAAEEAQAAARAAQEESAAGLGSVTPE